MNSSIRGCARSFVRQHGLNIGSVALAALMAGCGGGGSSHNDPQASQTPYRAIDASNAEAAVKLALEMTDVTDVLTASFGLGSGINETRCESGSGIGVVTNCLIGANTFSGSVTTTTSQTTTVTVPGDTRSRTVPTSLSLALTNLQWQSSNNRATYTIDGNLAITYTYPSSANGQGTASVTGTLTLVDAATGKRYQYRSLTQRYSVTVNTTLLDYQFEQTDHKGSVVYLDENSQYLMQPGTLVDYLSLTANKSKLSLSIPVNLLQPNTDYSLRIDTDNDGDYDTFATIPISEIGKDHGSTANPLSVSISRRGGGGDSPVGKRQPVTLAATGDDKDHRFYQYSWTITPAPGATGDNAATFVAAAQSTGVRSFASGIAGPYTMTVVATEVGVPTPASATASIIVTVAHDLPQMSVTNLSGAVGIVGAPVNFPVTLQGGEGAISAQLLGAPAGMTLTGNASSGYQLQWNPQSQFFPGSSETVTLQVSNEDQAAAQSFTVTGAGSPPEITPGLAVNSFTTDATLLNVDGDASAELLIVGSSSAFFGLNLDSSSTTTAIVNPYMFDSSQGSLLGVKPLRTNGTFNGTYAVATDGGVFVVDATTYAVRTRRGLQFNITSSTSKRRFAVADVNADGTDEIIALTKTSSSTVADHLYVLQQDLTTLAEIQNQPLGQQFLVGNVDTNPDLEIVCGSGLVLNAATLATKFASNLSSNSKNYVLADVDGDGIKEVVEATTGGFDVLDVDTNAHTSVPVGLSLNNSNLFALDAAGDSKDEVLIGDASNQVDIYSINKSGASATKIRTIGPSIANNAVTEVIRGEVLSSNSGDELVVVSRNSGGGALISVAPLGSGNLSLLVDGTTHLITTGGFAAARAQDSAIDNDFFISSLLGNIGGSFIASKGLLAVGTSGELVTTLTNIASDTELFAASADIDGNSQEDFVVSSKLRSDTDMSIMAQLTGISAATPVPIATGTPAPITVGQIDGDGNLDAVYVERSGVFGNETLDLVVHEVNGAEVARMNAPLQIGATVLPATAPIAVAIANLDGNATPDIVLLDGDGLRTFAYSAGVLTRTSTTPMSGTPAALAIGDIDGDGLDEIAVTSGGNSNMLKVYSGTIRDNALPLLGETAVTTPTAALTFYRATGSRPLWLYGSANTVAALDASTLTPVWISPALHGQINSAEVLATSLGNQLRVGSEGAIYRSQF